VLKKALIAILALILLALPLVARWLYFYEGRYEPGEVPRPDLTQIEEPVAQTEPFVDSPSGLGPGTILVDLAHNNHVQMAELGVLQARLAARGQRLESVAAVGDLAGQLRYAKALIVISPADDWSPAEIQQVETFVAKGGRLLLVTDPTRFNVLVDEWGDFAGLDYDVAHVNDLTARFGLLFQSDYLYNTVENEGNYRNIRLTDFATDELTHGLDQVVFYAAHSIVSEEPALIAAGGQTRSSSSERAEELTVAVVTPDGAVLALGDLTFMTEPHNAVYDNDRFLANIADFLSGAQRQYELADFPFFFNEQVDLVYTGDPLLDSDLLVGGSALQTLFADKDKELTIREQEDGARDTLFFGLYDQAEGIEPYLATAQVTLWITPTQALEEEATPTPTPFPDITSSSAFSEPLTTTLTLTSEPAITVTTEISPLVKNRVEIESFGEMVLTGTSLLFLQTDGERHVLVVLADTETGLERAIERLTEPNLEGCLLRETAVPALTMLALCPTGEVAAGEGGGGWQEPQLEPLTPPATLPMTDTVEPLTPSPTVPVTDTVEPLEPIGEPEGSIIVIALDKGQGRYDSMTSADDCAAILEERYDVTVWSTARDGSPDLADLLEYDLVIWTAGDFEDAFGDQEGSTIFALMLEGTPLIVSGAYVTDADTESAQRDIQVDDASHPLAQGFGPGQVIDFVPAPSGGEYETDVMEDVEEADGLVIFVRGPASEAAGSPAVFVLKDDFTETRMVFIGFPLYLLPEEPKSQLVMNAVSWLLSP
jgi:hypothetical protein